MRNIIQNLVRLGVEMKEYGIGWQNTAQMANANNPWFVPDHIRYAVQAIGRKMLQADRLQAWLSVYPIPVDKPKTIGLVMAGNVPLSGFHDLLCTLVSGHHALVKASSKDETLIKYAASRLEHFGFRGKIKFADQLKGADAFIATGSDNSARYFQYYFGKYPNIIRKNRNSVAVIDNHWTEADYRALGRDIFLYFGLGCRSVSKLYVPSGFDLERLAGYWVDWKWVMDFYKYKHNYDYNRTLLLMNGIEHYSNDFVMLTQHEQMASPVSVLYYREYDQIEAVLKELQSRQEEIQCVVGKEPGMVPPGQAQYPGPDDYADGIDTLQFLTRL